MSTSSDVALGSLRLQAQQRSDMENNPAISPQEWNQYISQSYKELYDILVSSYGNDYYVASLYNFSVTNQQAYALPDGSPSFQNANGTQAQKFYKLLGVDLQYSSSPSGYVTLKRFELIERNKYAYPNVAVNFNGYSNMRYRLEGNNLYFIPIPMAGQNARIWYIPAPTSLQFQLPCVTALGGTICSLSDTTGLFAGMNVALAGVVPNGTTIATLSSNSVTLSSNANATNPSSILSFWSDSTSLDGISGWEEYIIIDAAIKAQTKQEGPLEPLMAQKAQINQRIEAMAEGRDAGQAHHVSDALGANYTDNFGSGWGMGDGGGY